MQTRQWVEAHGIERAEYEPDIDDLIIDDIPVSELQNKCAMLYNALLSAQYQLNNLNDLVGQEHRIKFTQKVIESALILAQQIQSQV